MRFHRYYWTLALVALYLDRILICNLSRIGSMLIKYAPTSKGVMALTSNFLLNQSQ
jgi:hypothetical protein